MKIKHPRGNARVLLRVSFPVVQRRQEWMETCAFSRSDRFT
jgi:hypothetical protein